MQQIKKICINSSLALSGIVISLFFCDWALGLLGFPPEAPRRISHPVNYEVVRNNIEFQYIFKTNQQGLRYHDIPLKKPTNGHRVFVSGDSFTEGPGVQDGERFTDLLEGMFHSSDTSVSFINGGLSGTGPLKYGKLFLEVGVKYNPDALLICVFVNDIANTPENLSTKPFIAQTARPGLKEVAHALWPRLYSQLEFFYSQHEYRNQTKTSDFITTISKKARKRNIPQSQIKQWKESLPQELVNATNKGQFSGAILSKGLLYPEYWSDSIDISSKRAQNKWKSMTMILSEILNFAKKSEIETAVILIPSPFQYDPKLHSQTNPWIITGSEIRAEWLIEETEIQSRMRLWALSENVSFLDLTPAFREAAKSHRNLNYELDGHWNPWGHQVAANAIGSWLTERQIFSFMKK